MNSGSIPSVLQFKNSSHESAVRSSGSVHEYLSIEGSGRTKLSPNIPMSTLCVANPALKVSQLHSNNVLPSSFPLPLPDSPSLLSPSAAHHPAVLISMYSVNRGITSPGTE